jgi:protein SCO1/2
MSLETRRLALAVVLLLLAGGVGGWLLARSARHPGPRALPVLGQAPQYRGLTDQRGDAVDSSRFAGKVQVVTFLFPYCTTYCPLIAAHLAGLESTLELAGLNEEVEVVAFNVDPEGSGPAQMSTFLEEYGWDPHDRHIEFLTGAPREIRRVVTGGYHVAYQKDSGESGGGPALNPQPEVVNPLAVRAHVDYDIVHNDALEIVDGKGRIRKVYEQADVVSNARLLGVIKALLPSGS